LYDLEETEETKIFLKKYRGLILEYSYNSPFYDIRQEFQKLINELVDECKEFEGEFENPTNKVYRLPSIFLNPNLLPSIDYDKDKVLTEYFQKEFISIGIVSNLQRILGCFSNFNKKLQDTIEFVMKDKSGPLPEHYRNYIAILASSRFNCTYLIEKQEKEFILNGGNVDWIKNGIKSIPKKLSLLIEFIEILCHQPWLLSNTNVEKLVKDPIENGEEPWSVSELVHAITIISTFSSLSCFCYGVGIINENQIINNIEKIDINEKTNEVDDLVSKLKEFHSVYDDDDEEIDTKENYDAFIKLTHNDKLNDDYNNLNIEKDFSKYKNQTKFKYVDFDVQSKEYKVLYERDFNWKDQCYSLLNNAFRGSADFFDSEFDYIYNYTENTINNSETKMDTSLFRHSIWYYVSRIYGILHDDFDYNIVNQLMNIPLKKFIKKVACFPENVSINDFDNIGVNITQREKIHVVLLVIESLKQLQLIFALKSISHYKKSIK
jgi:sestrin 1/3